MKGHTAGVLLVKFDPFGSSIVSASQNGEIKVWDVASHKLKGSVNVGEFTENVKSIGFTPDGKWIYVSNGSESPKWFRSKDCAVDRPQVGAPFTILSWGERQLTVLRVPDGTVLESWEPAAAYSPRNNWLEVWSASLSPSGEIVALGPGDSHGVLSDCSVVLCDSKTGQVIRHLTGHRNHVRCVSFSPDSNLLVSGDEDGLIIVWDVRTGNQISQLEGHQGPITSVRFVGIDSILSSSVDGTLRRWIPKFLDESHLDASAWRVAASPDGKYLYRAGSNVLERIYTKTSRVVRQVDEDITSLAAGTSEQVVACETTDRRVTVRDCTTFAIRAYLKGPFSYFEDLAVGGKPALVASTNSSGPRIRVWSAITKRISTINRSGNGLVAFCNNGSALAGADGPGVISFWNPNTGRRIHSYSIAPENSQLPDRGSARIDVQASSDGGTLFFASYDGSLVAWDTNLNQAISSRRFSVNRGQITRVDQEMLVLHVASINARTAMVSFRNDCFAWDFKANVVLRQWSASETLMQLCAGQPGTCFGVADRLGLFSFDIPGGTFSPRLRNTRQVCKNITRRLVCEHRA